MEIYSRKKTDIEPDRAMYSPKELEKDISIVVISLQAIDIREKKKR